MCGRRRSGRIQGNRAQTPKKSRGTDTRAAHRPARQNLSPSKGQSACGSTVGVQLEEKTHKKQPFSSVLFTNEMSQCSRSVHSSLLCRSKYHRPNGQLSKAHVDLRKNTRSVLSLSALDCSSVPSSLCLFGHTVGIIAGCPLALVVSFHVTNLSKLNLFAQQLYWRPVCVCVCEHGTFTADRV